MRQPEYIEVIVTPAIRRALIAVNDQHVSRAYGPNGSVWECGRDGVSPRTLWRLLANHLMEDEPQTTEKAASLTTIRMRLSKIGLDFLRANLAKKA